MLKKLENRLKELEKVAICFSGGIDSSFLLFFANKVLQKENVLAIIANGEMMPRKDYEEALSFIKENGFNYEEIKFEPLKIKEFRENRIDRCYFCKKNLMLEIKDIAEEKGFFHVLDGSNLDDELEYRPGIKAKEELNILSPLEEAGFTKKDIRKEAKKLGISFWDKPSNSCLATRFPYDSSLDRDKLKKVEKAEEIIKEVGITNLRVRMHGDIVRIEVQKENFDKILKHPEITEKIKDLGIKYVTLDLFRN